MNMQAPIITDEQETILQWARDLQAKHYDVSTIVQLLVTSKFDKVLDKHWIKDETLQKVRAIYHTYNTHYKNNILLAIHLDAYRKEHDIREGQIVTNGEFVGFARRVDYQKRTFQLCYAKEDRAGMVSIINEFSMDDFVTVGGKSR
ncbi:hypothetical protein ACFYKX_11480 [Cytobacillus sp. FJAT-54145]|uniref:Uncharacterized protein n=1 Tax=Cytobacillus spartinae TaxID=3299023 RepID=A0ABW6KAL1_9BACI